MYEDLLYRFDSTITLNDELKNAAKTYGMCVYFQNKMKMINALLEKDKQFISINNIPCPYAELPEEIKESLPSVKIAENIMKWLIISGYLKNDSNTSTKIKQLTLDESDDAILYKNKSIIINKIKKAIMNEKTLIEVRLLSANESLTKSVIEWLKEANYEVLVTNDKLYGTRLIILWE